MARRASELVECSLAELHHRLACCAAREPSFVIRWRHNVNPSEHFRMVGSAILRAEQMIGAYFRSLKPQGRVTAWDDVLFHPERRDIEIVDDVFGGHGQLHWHAEGNV